MKKMKKILLIILSLIILPLTAYPFQTWTFNGLNGGAQNLDGRLTIDPGGGKRFISGDDMAIGKDANGVYTVFEYDTSSALSESLIPPYVIIPNDNVTGTGRWIQVDLGLGIDTTLLPNTPAGDIAATDTQSAINELDTEKAPISVYDPLSVDGDAFDRGNSHGTNSQINSTTATDPASNIATSTANIDAYDGIYITLTTAGVNQILQAPTDTTAGKNFLVANAIASVDNNIHVNGYVLEPGEFNDFTWDGSAWTGNNLASVFSINMGGTGLTKGGELTVNVDNTKFDIAAGIGVIIDNVTDHEKPDINRVTWDALDAQTIEVITPTATSYVAINGLGNVIQQSSQFTPSQMRSLISLGRIGHPNHTTITSISSSPRVSFDQTLEASDLAFSIGVISENNAYSGSVGDLHIDKAAGKSFREGANYYVDKTSPNNTTDAAANDVGFAYGWRDGSGGTTIGTPTLSIDPSMYDDGDGTLAAVSSNDFTIQRILFFPGSGSTFITYGQTVYNTYAEAKSALSIDPFDAPEAAREGASIRTLLIVRNNVSTFTDPVTDDSLYGFFQNNKFGGVGASASAGTTSLQQAYNNSSQPQILTDTLLGSMQFQGGTGDNNDKTVEFNNNAGSTTSSIDGLGNWLGLSFNGAPLTDAGAASNFLAEDGVYRIPSPTVETVNASRNITSADNNKILECSSASPIVLTVPTGVLLPTGVFINMAGTGQVSVAASGTTIKSPGALLDIAGQESGAKLYTISTNVHRLQGDLQ